MIDRRLKKRLVFVCLCAEGTVICTRLDSRHMAGLNTLQLHINLQVMCATACELSVCVSVCPCLWVSVLVCVSAALSPVISVTLIAFLPSLMPSVDMTVHDIICLFPVVLLSHISVCPP